MTKTSQKLGLVLSGGGIRGLAHAGVLKYLTEQKINVSYVAGTSAGAIVGALYAADYNAEEILEFFKSTSLFKWSRYAVAKPGLIDTDKFQNKFKDYIKTDSFASLSRQLYVTATDIEYGKPIIFDHGPILKPVLASMALPPFFSPVRINGKLYADGGIINNFPVEPLRKVADKIIGVHCSPLKQSNAKELKSSFKVLRRAVEITTAFSAFNKFHQCDLVILPEELRNYGLFDMNHCDEIFEIGYAAAKEQAEIIARLVSQQDTTRKGELDNQ